MSCVGVDRSRTITIFCCSVRPMFLVMCGLSCSLFMVVGCSCFYVVFVFYNRHLYFYLFYLISKGIFHLGCLVSKMHISIYMLFTEWKCFCFFHLFIYLFIIIILFFLLSTFFLFFSHTTSQHNIHSKLNNRHILHILKVQSKGRERGREKVTTKQVLPLYNHIC